MKQTNPMTFFEKSKKADPALTGAIPLALCVLLAVLTACLAVTLKSIVFKFVVLGVYMLALFAIDRIFKLKRIRGWLYWFIAIAIVACCGLAIYAKF